LGGNFLIGVVLGNLVEDFSFALRQFQENIKRGTGLNSGKVIH